jgi:hypothetical protein
MSLVSNPDARNHYSRNPAFDNYTSSILVLGGGKADRKKRKSRPYPLASP